MSGESPAESEKPTEIPFRPLARVHGHDRHRRWLAASTLEGRLPHALLVAGPRGVGKRTLVEATAIHVFCDTRTGCGECNGCQAWRHGNQVAWMVVGVAEGKTQITIAQIQELGRRISVRAPTDRGRIVMIRGADRMGDAAQDALLKTLEEPPPGNVLFLTAERSDRVFPTIRSRCQKLWLSPLNHEAMDLAAAETGLEMAVPLSLAGGCPGQLARYADPVVSVLRRGMLRILSGTRGADDYGKWTALLLHGQDPKPTTEILRERARLLWSLFASLLRDVLVLRECGGETGIRNEDLRGDLAGLTVALPTAAELLDRLSEARARIDGMIDPGLALFSILDPDEPSTAGPLRQLVQDL